MTSRCEFRDATAADAREFYGQEPTNTFRGIAAIVDGKVIGIGGLFYDNNRVIAFSDMKPEMRQRRKDMARACRMIVGMAKKTKRNVYAVAQEDEPTAAALLKKLGFVSAGLESQIGEVLIWKGE